MCWDRRCIVEVAWENGRFRTEPFFSCVFLRLLDINCLPEDQVKLTTSSRKILKIHICYNPPIGNIKNNKERIFKPKILRSSGIVSPSVAKEKAKKLAELEKEICELSKSLPDELHLETVYCKKGNGIMTFDILREPIFYQEGIDVIFSLYESKREEFYNKFGVDTNCEIFIEVFSDYEQHEEFKRFANVHPQEARNVAETSYFFDERGRSAKIIRLPAELSLQRTVIVDYDKVKECLSDMTPEDFILVERALSIIKQRCEDYLTWSKIHIFS